MAGGVKITRPEAPHGLLQFTPAPENIILVPLPLPLAPCAPELNPTENVREYPRANRVRNLVWCTCEAVAWASQRAGDCLVTGPEGGGTT
ncbi:MAG TPA: hypothetical protein VND19_20475 [Acetobacteraceae bacterium]|nr:hypothetical protein [Acetobacteraceae bacterium]